MVRKLYLGKAKAWAREPMRGRRFELLFEFDSPKDRRRFLRRLGDYNLIHVELVEVEE